MTDDLIHKVAKAVRRQQFARTRRSKAFDEAVPPTDNELDDARAAIEVVADRLSAYTGAYYTLLHALDDRNDL